MVWVVGAVDVADDFRPRQAGTKSISDNTIRSDNLAVFFTDTSSTE